MSESPRKMFGNAISLYYYLHRDLGYNKFLIEEVDKERLEQMKSLIDMNDIIGTVRLYKKIYVEVEEIRARHCENNKVYKSNFRAISKEMAREVKLNWLYIEDEWIDLYYILRRISTSNYYEIQKWLKYNSYRITDWTSIEIDCKYYPQEIIPIEAIISYAVKLYNLYKYAM